MEYNQVVKGRFLERPNRFIAMVEIGGQMEACHVKNTGRCRELLLPGAKVWLEKSQNPNRNTAYDLVTVQKGEALINMDSQAPNKVVLEWLQENSLPHKSAEVPVCLGAPGMRQAAGGLFPGITYVKPECKYGSSRFDFYVEAGACRKIFIEVKGVTLEEDGIARFPDAPTERGVKHLLELGRAVQEGYEGVVLFVIQMEGVRRFEPNDRTHPQFGEALRQVSEAGVRILAYGCQVWEGGIVLGQAVIGTP